MKAAKKRNKLSLLQVFAFMLAMAFMVSWGNPMTARADEGGSALEVNLLSDEPEELGGGKNISSIGSRTIPAATSGANVSSAMGGGMPSETVRKAPAYADLRWYPSTSSTVNTGRARNNITPNVNATGAHVVYKADATTGQVTNYTVYKENPLNPTGFDEVIRYDGVGAPHTNSVTGQRLMPHVHDKTALGGLRSPHMSERP